MGEFGIGQSVPREEDPYLLRGAGRYVDDVIPPGQLRATQARAMPGVQLALTGRDAQIRALGLQRPKTPRKRRDGSPAFASPQPLLAAERVRYIGDPVAFVVADTLNQAKDAAEAIAVDYEPLPAVVTSDEAVQHGAPAVWDECPDNQAFLHEAGNRKAVDEAFAAAAHVVRHRMTISRLTTNSLEPRGCLAEYQVREDRYTVRCTVQGPHTIRRILADDIFKLPEVKFRVVSQNVGGGAGGGGAGAAVGQGVGGR